MKEYKKPETRIKRVKDWKGEKFYAQYKMVIIPNIWWEWQNTRPNIEDWDYVFCLNEAKTRIEDFLIRDEQRWDANQLAEQRKRNIKKEVEYIKYPDEDE